MVTKSDLEISGLEIYNNEKIKPPLSLTIHKSIYHSSDEHRGKFYGR